MVGLSFFFAATGGMTGLSMVGGLGCWPAAMVARARAEDLAEEEVMHGRRRRSRVDGGSHGGGGHARWPGRRSSSGQRRRRSRAATRVELWRPAEEEVTWRRISCAGERGDRGSAWRRSSRCAGG
ncbi:hypothetical protein PR202_gb00912 [Eleusine coracana subsp. coracana]|uniref:Uncharacterized protein n=1 Tax=Eleusine coracana subsp. coracana TaxID=191504 RepID=A0AAV5DT23_ELECO|nr:hypothetical protein PR202_gb00912 [Eleusine coracana subsp. coracana]